MPSFDITSEVDLQEVRNAIDQAAREVTTRFDFKDTGASIELKTDDIELNAPSEDRLRALVQVLEEKLVRRQVTLKALKNAKTINKAIKDLNAKGVSSQAQGDQIRVTAKKRDDLQAVIQHLKEKDLGIPLQFGNFRD